MKNESEILFNSVAAIISNIRQMRRIIASRDISMVRSLEQFICGYFKQIKGYKYWV